MKHFLYILPILAVVQFSCIVPVDSANISDRIMITDENGNILGGKDDWCFDRTPPPFIKTQLKPAFPNPVKNNKVRINFELATQTEIILYIEPRVLIFSSFLYPGTYFIDVKTDTLGFKDEVKILKMKTSDGYECQGNIQF